MSPFLIDGYTQLVGLIGWPMEHSMSPAMHNAAFESLGLNWRYLPLPVSPGQVEEAVRGLAALGFRGANVTVPHKQAVMSVLDGVADDAGSLGAVNTIVVERDGEEGVRLSGNNTDAAGFVGALRDQGFDPAGTSAVVVGAGGGARAVVFGLREAGAAEILVLNRTVERARNLVSDLTVDSGSSMRAARLTPETLIEGSRSAQLLVNATSVGMWPQTEHSIWPDCTPLPRGLTVFDLVYNPLETRFLEQARRRGARSIEGLGMLVRQGALSFELWTGVKAPTDVMLQVCKRFLGC
jgi:shikimate dehydrogenase